MNLKKAIEILTQLADYGKYPHTPDAEKAIKLGSGALKRELHYRSLNQPAYHRPLPGETNE